jgi:hypothetical protein
LRNIKCKKANSAGRIIGLADSSVRDLSLTDITINADAGLHCTSASGLQLVNVRISPQSGPVLSLRDSQDVLIHGLHQNGNGGTFLDLRGRQTREIRLRGDHDHPVRPTIVLGLDVPKDALLHE